MSADPDIIFNALQQLDVCDVLPNDQNPRLLFPQEELDRLAESIDQTGILVPIVVYPKDGKYILVDGERRFRGAQTLGHSKVPAVITGEKTGLELLEQMFNIHLIREPWQDMPTARALQQLVEHLKRRNGTDPTDAELELETGLSLERVRRFRYVITLPDEWQQYIQTGTIPLNFFLGTQEIRYRSTCQDTPSTVRRTRRRSWPCHVCLCGKAIERHNHRYRKSTKRHAYHSIFCSSRARRRGDDRKLGQVYSGAC